ncbi:SDR family NAD(P)-dependent oxidoreductase [Amycolatopsis thermoflava]|uniref:SDR family NAD(P)-dependent oxidoreductase n=1 Tax=Amycolatopsis thermoflava TaxID=84480 RepID=UPI001E5FBF6E|nr:SDR family NAD(P)-dependent oxidoreductase [Amycolatopsis thermoflava]
MTERSAHTRKEPLPTRTGGGHAATLLNRQVLVTGADGFIGSHLVERLLAEGADVRALCVYNSNGSYGWLDELDQDLAERLDLRLGDIRDGRFVHEIVEGIDIVFHLAALIAIPYSYQAPASFVETNVTGTLNVLEAARALGGVTVVNTSTSEVYGTPSTVPIRESHPLRAQSPYAASKIAADQLCEAYARSFDLDVRTLRPFNTFGPRQSARAIIPTILGQLLAGHTRVRLGSLTPRRDFTYVSDTVDGFVRMGLADLAPGTLVQLGTGEDISIGELFDVCCRVTGADAVPETQSIRVRPRASEVEILRSDPGNAQSVLGWRAETALMDGIKRTAAWLQPRTDPHRAVRYAR